MNKNLFAFLICCAATPFAISSVQATVSCVTQEFDNVAYINCSNGFAGVGTDLGGVQTYAFNNGRTAILRRVGNIAHIVSDGGLAAVSTKHDDGLTVYGFGSGVSAVKQPLDGVQVFRATNGASAVSYPLNYFSIKRSNRSSTRPKLGVRSDRFQ